MIEAELARACGAKVSARVLLASVCNRGRNCACQFLDLSSRSCAKLRKGPLEDSSKSR